MDIKINLHFNIGDYIEDIGLVTSYEINPTLNSTDIDLMTARYSTQTTNLLTINFTGGYIPKVHAILAITQIGNRYKYHVNYVAERVFFDGPKEDLVTVSIPKLDELDGLMNLME